MKARTAACLTITLAGGLLFGCPLAIEPSSSSVIGDTCSTSEDCGIGWCNTKTEGGYCAMDCTNEPCPEGARCVEIHPPLLPKIFTCMRVCRVTADCGRAGVICQPPPFATSSEPVCT